MASVGHDCLCIRRHPDRFGAQLPAQLRFAPQCIRLTSISRAIPFDLTPDPNFLFLTRRHNEALAALYHGIRRHKGFVVVTGEVGTGKTLLLRCLLQLLQQSKDIAYAYLFNSRLCPTEFLQYVVSDFGLSASGKNKGELLLAFGHFLVSRGSSKLDHCTYPR